MNKEELSAISEETKLRLHTKTLVKLNKKDKDKNPNELGDIFKLQVIDVIINRPYTVAVNEARVNEGAEADFVAKERSWKAESQTNAISEKGGVFYLSSLIDPDAEVHPASYIDACGSPVDEEAFKPFRPPYKASPTTQGVESVVKPRVFKLDSILSVEILK